MRIFLWVMLLAAVLGGIGYFVFDDGDKTPVKVTERTPTTKRIADAKPAKPAAKSKAKKTKSKVKGKDGKTQRLRKKRLKPGKGGPAPDRFAGLPAADRKLGEALQAALDAEDGDAIMREAELAMKSESVAVRELAVEALAWKGKAALPELAELMADANEGVSEQARDAVENVLTDHDDSVERFNTAASLMSACTADKDAQTMFGGILRDSANEFVDPVDDTPQAVEEARQNRQVIVETLASLIAKGGVCAEQAKSTYEDVAGRKWTDAQSASAWVDDPDAE